MAGGCDVQHARQERIRPGTEFLEARRFRCGLWVAVLDGICRLGGRAIHAGVFAVVVESASRAA